eukprot:SAG31_NODE_5287_length_2632_cov_1.938808_1_plen_736_part_01
MCLSQSDDGGPCEDWALADPDRSGVGGREVLCGDAGSMKSLGTDGFQPTIDACYNAAQSDVECVMAHGIVYKFLAIWENLPPSSQAASTCQCVTAAVGYCDDWERDSSQLLARYADSVPISKRNGLTIATLQRVAASRENTVMCEQGSGGQYVPRKNLPLSDPHPEACYESAMADAACSTALGILYAESDGSCECFEGESECTQWTSTESKWERWIAGRKQNGLQLKTSAYRFSFNPLKTCSNVPNAVMIDRYTYSPSCQCAPGYRGTVTLPGAFAVGTCTPAPCNVAGSDNQPGPDCRCRIGYEGNITWVGDTPTGPCVSFLEDPCYQRITCPNGTRGATNIATGDCGCEDAPCNVLFSNELAGLRCECDADTTGDSGVSGDRSIGWTGDEPNVAECVRACSTEGECLRGQNRYQRLFCGTQNCQDCKSYPSDPDCAWKIQPLSVACFSQDQYGSEGPSCLPGIEKLGLGYSALTLETSLPVVLTPLAGDQGDRRRYEVGGRNYDYPLTVHVERYVQQNTEDSTSVFDSKETYSRDTSTKFGIEASTNTAAVSVSVGLQTSDSRSVEQALERTQVMSMSRSETLSFKGTVLVDPPLAIDFEVKVEEMAAVLPYLPEHKKRKAMKQLFDTYGTHYVWQGFFGGSIEMKSFTDKCSGDGSVKTTSTIASSVSVSFGLKKAGGGSTRRSRRRSGSSPSSSSSSSSSSNTPSSSSSSNTPSSSSSPSSPSSSSSSNTPS